MPTSQQATAKTKNSRREVDFQNADFQMVEKV